MPISGPTFLRLLLPVDASTVRRSVHEDVEEFLLLVDVLEREALDAEPDRPKLPTSSAS